MGLLGAWCWQPRPVVVSAVPAGIQCLSLVPKPLASAGVVKSISPCPWSHTSSAPQGTCSHTHQGDAGPDTHGISAAAQPSAARSEDQHSRLGCPPLTPASLLHSPSITHLQCHRGQRRATGACCCAGSVSGALCQHLAHLILPCLHRDPLRA